MAAILNLISLIVILSGLIIVKKWIKDAFLGERKWRLSVDGRFHFYFVLFLILTLVQLVNTLFFCLD